MNWNLDEAVLYYKKQGAPSDQNAVISLLREVQQENGGSIPRYVLAPIAQGLGTKESLLLAIVRRIPSLRLADTHCLELCSGPNCGRHTALADLAESLFRGKGVTIRYVPCMRMCAKGPNLRWDGRLYHKADEALLRSFLAQL
ncbi:MAG: (2Fe-2S) ferredoxin domain-containing protein [Oscillospiraceae bacterium]|nr:(2Fe-2S) ferredoxin domain-containing protein [Oscillospiraceae bacterium]